MLLGPTVDIRSPSGLPGYQIDSDQEKGVPTEHCYDKPIKAATRRVYKFSKKVNSFAAEISILSFHFACRKRKYLRRRQLICLTYLTLKRLVDKMRFKIVHSGCFYLPRFPFKI